MFADRHRGRSADMPGQFFVADVPRAVIAAFAAQHTELLYACGLASMIPGLTASEKAAITVPTFIALGDQDLVVDLITAAGSYTSCDDLTLFRLTGSGHCTTKPRRV
jgi:pimeloyl-ACP methyl ester carboxylesterase